MDSFSKTSHTWRRRTQLVRGGLDRSGFDETSEALFLTSGYVYKQAQEAREAFDGTRDRFVYSRFANPTVRMFEQRLALIEGARHCRATASGMAAVHGALAALVKAGDRVVASRALFGSCHYIIHDILPRFGVETELVDGKDLDTWRTALSKPTAAVFIETPSNPTLEIIDIPAVAEMTHRAGGRLVVDNVFATPLLQSPLTLGADIVVYSATKHIDGQGRCLGGAILSSDTTYVEEILQPFLRHTGPALSPFNAWVLLKGLETLEMRVQRMSESALRLAAELETLPGIDRVLYPFLPSHPQCALARRQMSAGGTVVAFEMTGGRDHAFQTLDRLQLIDISNNLGDSKSLITHPATTTHHRLTPEERSLMGVSDGLVRLSVGLEDEEDLLDDLKTALAT